MTSWSIIDLPKGTKYVTVGQVPALIARALAPNPTGLRTLYELRRVLPDGREVSLNQRVRKALIKAWHPRKLKLGITESEWTLFAFALMDNDDDEIPEIRPIWNSPSPDPAYNRGAANAKQKRMLLAVIKSGKLTPENAPGSRSRDTKDRITPDARIPLKAFKDYVKGLGILVRLGTSGTPAPGTPEYQTLIASRAAEALHSSPTGTRGRREKIRKLWLSGKYSSREECARKEFKALNMSHSTARKALINTPDIPKKKTLNPRLK